jgi:hypothetical protein
VGTDDEDDDEIRLPALTADEIADLSAVDALERPHDPQTPAALADAERQLADGERGKAEQRRRRAVMDPLHRGLHLEVAELHEAAAAVHERAAQAYEEFVERRREGRA